MKIAIFALVLLVFLQLNAQEPLRPKLQQALDGIAGAGAKNCGAVQPGQFAMAASSCAEDAFRKRLPFYVVYYVGGMGTGAGGGLAEGAKGEVVELRFDPGVAEKIEVNACAKDVQLVMSRGGRLRCENGHYSFESGVCGAFPRETAVSSFGDVNGTVAAELVVHPDGTATVAEITQRDVPAEVADAVLRDVAKWRFAPALKDGTPVAVRYPVQIRLDGTHEVVSFPEAGRSGCAATERVIGR